MIRKSQFRLLLLIVITIFFSSKANAQFPYYESFRDSTAPGITFGGEPKAFLTAGSTQVPDKEDEGYLRLTSRAGHQKGYIYYNTEFPSRNGLKVEFEYFTYNGNPPNGADGITLFLFDGTVTPDNFNIGGFGGSLGYAQLATTSPFSKGVSKGYLGVALDEFGNFSNPIEGRQGGPGPRPGSVTIRGKGDGTTLTPENYKYLTSVQTTTLGFSLIPELGSPRYPLPTSEGYRKVFLDLKPDIERGYRITVRITVGGTPTKTYTVIDNFHYEVNAPPTLKYGIASSTGGSINIHEIRGVTIDIFEKYPNAYNDTINVCQGQSGSKDITANDVSLMANGSINKSSIDLRPDIAGTQTSYLVPDSGFFEVISNGIVKFTPRNNIVGSVSATYTIKDNSGLLSSPATITANIFPVPAQANAGPNKTVNLSGSSGSTNLAANIPTGNIGVWSQLSGPNSATISNVSSNNTAISNLLAGIYTFTWTIGSGVGCETTDNVEITVNNKPIAINDEATTGLNKPVQISIHDNDTDADGNNTINKSSLVIKTQPINGLLKIDPISYKVTYTPDSDFEGEVKFTYSVRDNSNAESNDATVTIAVNIRPTGIGDFASTFSNIPVTVNVNNNDPSKSFGTVIPRIDGNDGKIYVNPDQTITYDPNEDYHGKDFFSYVLRNNEGLESDPIQVKVDVRPIGINDEVISEVNTLINIAVKSNDPSKIGSSIINVTASTNGKTEIINGQTINYTPNTDYYGEDTFTYVLKNTDGLESNPISVRISLKPQGSNDEAILTEGNTSLLISVKDNDLSTNGTDVIISTVPANGKILLDSDNAITYTPNAGFKGDDSFTYTLRNTEGLTSDPITVVIKFDVISKLGVAKALIGPKIGLNGTHDVTFVFTIVNYGLDTIERISLKDDLSIAFPGTEFSIKEISATAGDLKVNPLYNGTSDIELLLPISSISPEAREQRVTIKISIKVLTGDGVFENSAFVKGYSAIDGQEVKDQSRNGYKPDADRVPGDIALDDPTPITLNKQPLFVPGGFSPNNDGINDLFVIQNLDNHKISLEIFNRWGNRIYQSLDYQNNWDGRSTEGISVGEYVPTGTYYYIIKIDNESPGKSGYLTINK